MHADNLEKHLGAAAHPEEAILAQDLCLVKGFWKRLCPAPALYCIVGGPELLCPAVLRFTQAAPSLRKLLSEPSECSPRVNLLAVASFTFKVQQDPFLGLLKKCGRFFEVDGFLVEQAFFEPLVDLLLTLKRCCSLLHGPCTSSRSKSADLPSYR